jgi:LPS-assembly lipoprotein
MWQGRQMPMVQAAGKVQAAAFVQDMTPRGNAPRLRRTGGIVLGLALALGVLTLTGCGFHLRGASPNAAALARTTVHLQAGGAPFLAGAMGQALDNFSVPLVAQPSAADLILTLNNEDFASRVVSFDPETGKVREFELVYQVMVSATDRNGATVLAEEPLNFQRDYTFDDNAVLGAFSQDQTLRLEIARDAADAILRRLISVGVPSAAR